MLFHHGSFQFEPTTTVHKYQTPKTFSSLIGDIGGHIGIFLGWSAYTIVDLLQGWIKERRRLREEAKKEALEALAKSTGNFGTLGDNSDQSAN